MFHEMETSRFTGCIQHVATPANTKVASVHTHSVSERIDFIYTTLPASLPANATCMNIFIAIKM